MQVAVRAGGLCHHIPFGRERDIHCELVLFSIRRGGFAIALFEAVGEILRRLETKVVGYLRDITLRSVEQPFCCTLQPSLCDELLRRGAIRIAENLKQSRATYTQLSA